MQVKKMIFPISIKRTVAAAFCSLAILGGTLYTGTDLKQTEPDIAARRETAGQRVPDSPDRGMKPPPMADGVKPSSGNSEPGAGPEEVAYGETQFEEYSRLTSKAILTDREQETYHSLLNDVRIHQHTVETLTCCGNGLFDKNEERERIHMIRYVSEALEGGDRNTREFFLDYLEKRVFDRSFRNLESIRLRKSYVGDKIEYLELMKKHDPVRFDQIREQNEILQDKVLTYCLKQVT